jgi:hypothetical protein
VQEEQADIWKIAFETGPANKDVVFFTWEGFENPEHVERRTAYITESGPEVFDAALAKDAPKVASGRVLKRDVLLESLWNLGLGRSSILFSWDASLWTFVPTIADGRASGLTLPSAKSLTNQFILIGSTFLYLRSFVERTFASATSIPALVALGTCVSSILATFEDHLSRHSKEIRSLLQLQHLFTKPRQILVHVARLVDIVKHATTNEQLASILHHRILELEEDDQDLRRLSLEILCRASKPSMELMSEWIGIRKEQDMTPIASRGSFVILDQGGEDQGPHEYTYDPEMMPRFITPEDGSTIFATGSSLRFLTMHHPDHPLASLGKQGIQPPQLEWKFDWQDIDAITAKAKSYEDQLRQAILRFARGLKQNDETLIVDEAHAEPAESQSNFEQDIEESVRLFDSEPGHTSKSLPDELQLLTADLLADKLTRESTRFSPPISLTSTLSFQPLLAAQAKLVNAASLRLFFRSHQLRLHLSLQRQYHLLGDGVFSSRLASALFDPDRESAERHKGIMRSGVHMGLQLGSRSAWPPASSELRLALMGVLSESFYSSALYHSTAHNADYPNLQARKDKDELPGQLAFSIRQLTEPEMEKVMDPDSLYALDFLRLQYVPPSPLNLVISSSALEKYDDIFKFLLRLLRMLFVVSRLPRTYPDTDSYRFRMEAHHFVTAISAYIFQTGIGEHWNDFESYIATTETRLAEEDAASELATRVTEGLDAIKAAHEQCLDSILFSLLLRRRQKKVMSLLEEIFDHILLFAKMKNGGTERDNEVKAEENEGVRELYAKSRGKIKVFISVCRGLVGKRGYGKGRGTGEENMLERLGVLLEMNGYYT